MGRARGLGRTYGAGTRRRYRRGVLQWLGVLIAAVVLTGFAVLLLTGEYIRSGPVLVRLSEDHGIHRGDIGIVAFWTLGMFGLALSASRRVARRP